MWAAYNKVFVVIRDGDGWVDEDGNITTDRSEAKVMPYAVAEAYISMTWRDNEKRVIERKDLPPHRETLHERWLRFQIGFLESFYEPNDTTMFPPWIAKQVRIREDKIARLRKGGL